MHALVELQRDKSSCQMSGGFSVHNFIVTDRKQLKQVELMLFLVNMCFYGILERSLKENRILNMHFKAEIRILEYLFPVVTENGLLNWTVRVCLYWFGWVSGTEEKNGSNLLFPKQPSRVLNYNAFVCESGWSWIKCDSSFPSVFNGSCE